MIGPYDDWENGPGFWEPDDLDARDEAFHEGAASREPEVQKLADELRCAEQVIAEQKAEIEKLTRQLWAAGQMEAA